MKENIQIFFILFIVVCSLALCMSYIRTHTATYPFSRPYPSFLFLGTALALYFFLQAAGVFLFLNNKWARIGSPIPFLVPFWGLLLLIALLPARLKNVISLVPYQFAAIKTGCVSALLYYPAALGSAYSMFLFLQWLGICSYAPQAAVSLVRSSESRPYEMLLSFSTLTIAVPIIEEIIFRGLLQQKLSAFVGSALATALTSCCFVWMHMHPEQMATNYTIAPSLFCFSCLAGALFAKTQNLWSTISMHATFNFIGIVSILILQR